VLSAAAPEIPRRLLEQLELPGVMILPFGDEEQHLVVLEKTNAGLTTRELGTVRFVKMHGNS
jgi:protein-L-isoaspartate(D-aspartate) O-methyltransferase